ncbi:MAG: NAD-dependent epimerase/dehydratase family protein [Acidobacteriota bacterium]
MPSILVTGGAGFIGSHVVDRLLAQSETSVTVVDNFDDFYDRAQKRRNIEAHLENPAYRLLELDIRDSAALEMIGERFDAIIHLAARAGVRPSIENARLYQEVNIAGTLNLLEYARHFHVPRFVFGSSSSVYGPTASLPFREDSALAPISPYAATKAAAEMLTFTFSHLFGLRVLCLRFFTVYGARQRPDLAIHKFTRRIIEGTPIPVFGDGSTERDYTFVEDIVDGIIAALSYEATLFEIINLGESQTVTLNRLIELLEKESGREAIIERHPLQDGDLPRTWADISKARRLLGYQPQTPIEIGIPKFVQWFREMNLR